MAEMYPIAGETSHVIHILPLQTPNLLLLVRAIQVGLSMVLLAFVANARQILCAYSSFCIPIIQTSFLFFISFMSLPLLGTPLLLDLLPYVLLKYTAIFFNDKVIFQTFWSINAFSFEFCCESELPNNLADLAEAAFGQRYSK